jgi:hypothetical protein
VEDAQAEAAVTVSFTVTSFAAIGIGFSLAVLLDLLQTPTELAPAGLLEYPVDFNTDFDTYTDWNLANSAFYNSLKTYAETVKTMKLIASGRGVTLSLTPQQDAALKATIDKACEQQSGTTGGGCGTGFAVYVPGAQNYLGRPMPDTGKHIVAAMGNGILPVPQRYQWFYPAYSKGGALARAAKFTRGWYDTATFKPLSGKCATRPAGEVCDEFPFWTTSQAVNLSGMLADLAPVPGPEGPTQGTDTSQFYGQCKVNDTDHFIVLPIKPWVDLGMPSFGFRVDTSGASMCLVPR